ncbi:MAG: hypothetical protein K2G58_05090, partial [Alistipes sp.]|nr:hypothetical protein [Alistipes sp.]
STRKKTNCKMEVKKISALPGEISPTWQTMLKNMGVNEALHFRNVDSSLCNARAAISRYYQRMQIGKLPYRRFTAIMNRCDHSFTITRIE